MGCLAFPHECNASENLAGCNRWILHSGAPVRSFRFHRDGLFLAGCAAYLLNRLLLKPHVHSAFLHSQFNDLWLIPCALPLVLWFHRKLGWRGAEAPSLLEVIGHLLLWSILFEWLGPHLIRHATGDPLDVACYWIGGLAAWAWWNRAALRQRFNLA